MEGKIDSKKLVMIAAISMILVLIAVVGASVIIRSCGVDTSVSTPDEQPATEFVTDAPEDNTTPTTPDGKEYTVTQDWAELKGINEEIVAWIDIPNTDINYPVLMHDGDGPGYQYYLHRNFDDTYLYAGSVFIDYRSTDGVNNKHIITHGHNMNNGTMYADLLDYGKYSGDLEAYKNAPTLFIHTPEGGVEQWIIFSVYKTSTLEVHGEFFNYLLGTFSSDAQYMNYIYNLKERSFFDVPVPINEDDQIITLSTCSYEYTDFRTVAVARKLRPGESAKQYIDATTLNKDALWPEVHYNNNGSLTAPEVTTFKTELSKGNIDWYDGDGNLQGDEWLPSVAGKQLFTVTFINYDGSIISTQNVPYGRSATAPEDPVKPSEGNWAFVFKGWQLDFSDVRCNMTIAPNFEAVYIG